MGSRWCLYTPDHHIIIDISAFVSLDIKTFYRGVEELLSGVCSQQVTFRISSKFVTKSFFSQAHPNES